MSTLAIWVGSERAASLRQVDQTFELHYTPAWQQAGGFSFSPHLPVGQATQGAAVKNFFSNLLPEGHMLESLSRAHQVSRYDVFGILRKIGRDCAGALVILDENEQPEAVGQTYLPITALELNQRAVESGQQDVPLMFWQRAPRMSLAGVQNKLGVYLNQDGTFALPQDSAPTSHILKVGDAKLPGIAANEFFCMQLAHAIGLTVPATLFQRLPEPVFLVKRYDRLWTPDGGLIRIHQIDGCQALNLPPQQKYEEPEYTYAPPGATLSDLFELAALCKTPALAKTQILQWIIFNYLIGNSDAHAKNLSFLIDPLVQTGSEYVKASGMHVAPFYDLVCGVVYGFHNMAQQIGGESRFERITTTHWRAFVQTLDIKPKVIATLAKNLCKRLDKRLPSTVARATEITHGEAVVQEIAQCVENHILCLLKQLAPLSA